MSKDRNEKIDEQRRRVVRNPRAWLALGAEIGAVIADTIAEFCRDASRQLSPPKEREPRTPVKPDPDDELSARRCRTRKPADGPPSK